MIDFVCKKIDREDILKCSFDLNKTEYSVFSFLFKKDSTIKNLYISLKLDRTTVQKSISRLLKKGLITRSKIRYKRGYAFVYSVKNKKEFKKKLHLIIDSWYYRVRKEIESF